MQAEGTGEQSDEEGSTGDFQGSEAILHAIITLAA